MDVAGENDPGGTEDFLQFRVAVGGEPLIARRASSARLGEFVVFWENRELAGSRFAHALPICLAYPSGRGMCSPVYAARKSVLRADNGGVNLFPFS